ncbi:MFS transporter [Granulicella tundricola]|nr:MFS transporter [Granulicella tundricola]
MKALYRRVTLRVIPLLIVLYFTAFLDRVNVSFASITMNRDLGIGESAFGLAAGVFFIGYLVFSLPSNLMLERFGARRWIGIIMVALGLLSCATAFIHTASTYIVLRFMIGAAEAGFFPGVILYLTLWLPASVRASLMALFTLSIPLSNVIGAPLSAAILSLNGRGGLQGWQWLFLMEGCPAIVLGCAVPFLLAARPQEVSWLTTDESRALGDAIAREETLAPSGDGVTFSFGQWFALFRSGLIYFFLMVGLYELSFWIPRILHDRGVPAAELGWKTAIPFAVGGLGMVLWSRFSDRSGRGQMQLAFAFIVGASGLVLAGVGTGWLPAVAGLSITSIGVLAGMPIFWAWVTAGMGAERAFAIAGINSIGNIGGFLGPYLTGMILEHTHSFRPGMWLTAACLLCGAGLTSVTSKRPGHLAV